MAQAREKGGRVVFIGNIPYGVSEEQICDLFGRVGTVVHFRLVYDKETHRPKGFGFLEYTNVDDAASAVRNLNDHELMGRKIKVDYSNDNGGGGATTTTTANTTSGPPNGTGAAALPRLPEGAALPPGIQATDAISTTLKQIPPPVLLDVLSQMKNLVGTNPAQATALLSTAPQLSYAIFQAMLLLGLVDPNVLGSLIQQTQPQQAPPTQYQPPPQPFQQPPPAQYGAPQQSYAPPPQSYGTPPVTHNAYQPPPPQAAPPAIDNQQEILNKVLAMPYSEWVKLPDNQREMINTLRQQYGAPPMA